MDDKVNAVIEKIVRLSKQNNDFKMALQKELGLTFSLANSSDISLIKEIYEYCIKKILERQAKEFYSDFPLKDIVNGLESDFIRMESYRREDNFEDFCLALYQQIENITNYLCESKELEDIASKMWAFPAYVKEDGNKSPILQERIGNYSIASLLFPGVSRENDHKPYSYLKSRQSIQSLFAKDKMRTIVYFIGYKAMMLNSDYKYFKEITNLLSDLYACRNMNHRGNTPNSYEMQTMNRILPIKSFYYFKFMGALAQYVDYVKNGIPSEDLKKFAKDLPKKEVELEKGVKVVGYIDPKLLDDGKKRIKT